MADIDLANKILKLKKQLQEKENNKIKLETQIEMTKKTLKEKYNLLPEQTEEYLTKLRDKIKITKNRIEKGVKAIEEEYELN
jgi:hypothetical protein